MSSGDRSDVLAIFVQLAVKLFLNCLCDLHDCTQCRRWSSVREMHYALAQDSYTRKRSAQSRHVGGVRNNRSQAHLLLCRAVRLVIVYRRHAQRGKEVLLLSGPQPSNGAKIHRGKVDSALTIAAVLWLARGLDAWTAARPDCSMSTLAIETLQCARMTAPSTLISEVCTPLAPSLVTKEPALPLHFSQLHVCSSVYVALVLLVKHALDCTHCIAPRTVHTRIQAHNHAHVCGTHHMPSSRSCRGAVSTR